MQQSPTPDPAAPYLQTLTQFVASALSYGQNLTVEPILSNQAAVFRIYQRSDPPLLLSGFRLSLRDYQAFSPDERREYLNQLQAALQATTAAIQERL